jgi:hypothetical protein
MYIHLGADVFQSDPYEGIFTLENGSFNDNKEIKKQTKKGQVIKCK